MYTTLALVNRRQQLIEAASLAGPGNIHQWPKAKPEEKQSICCKFIINSGFNHTSNGFIVTANKTSGRMADGITIRILLCFWMILVVCHFVHAEMSDVPCDTNIYLEVGKQETVPCRFFYFDFLGWIYGDGEASNPFIYLEHSEKKGRGYDSGEYDILPDGSLIINHVGLKDEGNFTVLYESQMGARIFFSVPVTVLEFSDPPCDINIYLEVGKKGTVHCNFQDFTLLGWIKGNPKMSTPFIYLENSEKKGRGYVSGEYDILPDGSLIINSVEIKDEYVFNVLYVPPQGDHIYFKVPVRVMVRPSPEYPVVNGLTNQQYIYQEVEFYSGPINCTMDRVRPGVDLEWVYQSDGISMERERHSIVSNTDGTYNTSLSCGFTIMDHSLRKFTLQCAVAGEMAELFPSVTTIYLLKLNKHFPVVNGQARQQHLVLQLKRQDEINCSMYRLPEDISLEWVIVNSELSSEITFKDDVTRDDNGDGTSNVTLKSSFNVMSSSVQHVTLQCTVFGKGASQYPDFATVDILFYQSTSSGNTSQWTFSLNTLLILLIGFTIIFLILFKKKLKEVAKNHFVPVQESEGIELPRRDYHGNTEETGTLLDQRSHTGASGSSASNYGSYSATL